ncbi:uncharacterized protein LOC106946868 isoform X1 [Poecilia latipinna]|uniref:uncharacterized protein LOC106946868 isoform X1 n=1 Tax=Poecilia latipinna TaxID=48699 RepID=UPI00072DE362|nr:PREDICTED: uncharacterized protein LOC106946868 isoform X1 [Poecilia latipinna]XP_014887018.1 PREDICTED: uncharacterized protein LOC106946868 isoform X1 [Poecilia latipinna]XP_014887020.1 PREDICTED: uncharacterized protein LOC106946868 isoform X1 [Poecilia latipinna]
MAAAVGLWLLLLGVSQGLSAHCDARNNGTQCSGTLGETVFLRLIHNASGIKIDLLKGNVILLQWRKNITVANEIKDRFDFIPDNGTFRLNDLKHNDSGEYKLTVFDSNGKSTENRTLHLSVQGTSSLTTGLITSSICVVLLFFIILIVIYVWRKKQKRKETEDLTDLTYAVVTTVQKPARRPDKQKEEEEVEYGQIKSAG